ncbi:MAG: hypothetical protein KTR13_10385 [Saprospiraceae bacterium]|nr:hypothetical protein [Saprospiraceae bacterium]
MNLQADIKWIQEELKSITDVKLVEALKNILLRHKDDQDINIEEYSRELDLAREKIANGEVVSHDDVKQKFNCAHLQCAAQ